MTARGPSGNKAPAHFTVTGKPVAKARPRFARAGGHVRAFTPKTSAQFEERVRLAAVNAGVRLIEGPVALNIKAYWPCIRPLKRSRRLEEWKATRPDVDNIAKVVLDGLQGVAYNDDGQVCSIFVQTLYAEQGTPPRTEIGVVALDGAVRTLKPGPVGRPRK